MVLKMWGFNLSFLKKAFKFYLLFPNSILPEADSVYLNPTLINPSLTQRPHFIQDNIFFLRLFT